MRILKTLGPILTLGLIFSSTYMACQGQTGFKIKAGQVGTEASSNEPVDDYCQGEGNCECSVQLNNIVDGRTYDLGPLNYHSGGMPENMFLSGGSENINLMCNTGLYLHSGRKEWVTQYFDVQKVLPVTFGGNELFSAGYFQQTVGAILVILNEAIERNHTDVEQKAAEWLTSYWAFLALSATQQKPAGYSHTLEGGPRVTENPGQGLGVNIVGTRNYVNQGRGTGLQHIFLSIALENSPRDLGWDLNHAPGANGGLRAFLAKVGYTVESRGYVRISSRSVSPRQVGLTDETRAWLKNFIASNGRTNMAEVLSMINGRRLACPITFYRTDSGVITWFGNSTGNTPTCSGAKGGSYNAVKFIPGQPNGEILARVRIDNQPGLGETWRNSDRICANASDMPTECIDMPSGAPIYEILADRDGVRCIQGACGSGGGGGGTPPPPQVTTTTRTQTTPPPPGPLPENLAPEPPQPGTCGDGKTLCLLNNRFKVTLTWYNQWNQTSGVGAPIPFTSYVGYYAFTADPNDIQIVVKVNDFGTKQLVYFAELTKTMFKIRFTDTVTGVSKVYQNTNGDCGGTDPDFNGNATLITGGAPATLTRLGQIQSPGGRCTASNTTLCFLNNRYAVTIPAWRNHYNDTTGSSKARPISSYTGGHYFSGDQNDINVFTKILQYPDKNLFFYGSLTNFEYTMRVIDTTTGKAFEVRNPAETQCGGFINDLLTSEYLR